MSDKDFEITVNNSCSGDILEKVASCIKECSLCLLVGIGNSMRGDDGVGPYIVSKLIESDKLKLLNVGEHPERMVDVALSLQPDFLIIVDAADVGVAPGMLLEIAEASLRQNAFSTHRIPINVVTQVIKEDCSTEILIIGIQPNNMELGTSLSVEVEGAADILLEEVRKCC